MQFISLAISIVTNENDEYIYQRLLTIFSTANVLIWQQHCTYSRRSPDVLCADSMSLFTYTLKGCHHHHEFKLIPPVPPLLWHVKISAVKTIILLKTLFGVNFRGNFGWVILNMALSQVRGKYSIIVSRAFILKT